MCTVSIVPGDGGFRVISNRDERRDRTAALQPSVNMFGGRSAIMPIDPAGGGSWIGVNDAGLVAAVLNRHPEEPATDAGTFASRGLLVPHALGSDSLGAAVESVRRLEANAFQPFRLVLVQHGRIALVAGDGRKFTGAESALDRPHMFTASSLGDVLVDSPRRRLFECLMDHACGQGQGQLLFHHHQWLDARDISVVMEREDAATVSRTIVDVTERGIALEYESLIPFHIPERVELQPC